jgi:disulfide bond formation protein DsbB
MQDLASRLRPHWPLLTLTAYAAMLAAAHLYFQRFLGLQPCPLCLDQRNWHWAVVGVSLAAFVALRFRPGVARWAALIIGLVLLGSAAMGAYHVAVEQHWVIAQCDARIDPNDIRPLDFNERLEAPRCDDIAWSLLGVSMAGYNALISLLLALASFAVAAAPERKS